MSHRISSVYDLFRGHFLWCLIGFYVLGAVYPTPGLWIRNARVLDASLLKWMLGLLLLNAGLGIERKQVGKLGPQIPLLLAGVTVSFLVPGILVGLLSVFAILVGGNHAWANGVLGLAIVAAMPTAGSSTAWAQNAEGNLALSVGLVLCTTLVCPLTAWAIPWSTHAILRLGIDDTLFCSEPHTMFVFLSVWVLLPVCVGVAIRHFAGSERVIRIKPLVKLVNLVNLLLLNYANASLALPTTIADPDAGQLGIVLAATGGLAVAAFGSAGLLSWRQQTDRAERVSLFFGIGMKNNGVGLVLASAILVAPGPALLPIILYNLAQHLAAAVVDRTCLS